MEVRNIQNFSVRAYSGYPVSFHMKKEESVKLALFSLSLMSGFLSLFVLFGITGIVGVSLPVRIITMVFISITLISLNVYIFKTKKDNSSQ
ncbi:hypothetical protein NEF87_003742 [Candidatus Lokiarchaeum ossiferum]|uniref:Uncharacterized protein n=1 Tax=Candidatus Lokiarchaeum ossiferum TaxID=2951803 RepID=A0ABY6HX89_9ARCH|nr:hypothetical protein NEF87_003742 [Candidatus Lokiarchaeum sp. B-35]